MTKAGALSSWNEGAAKSAIVDFVARVTREGGKDYVAPAERIATFDNDGTLWCEQPIQVQAFFLIDRTRQLAAMDPALEQRQPFKALLELGKQGIHELFSVTHAGMSEDEFGAIARTWFASSRHPKLGRPFTQLT